ncbi:MAG TPA: DUF4252 domain-containing protein [Bacteroidota bacterium]|nr:DUF4252 domain-containing protein [Candidatus Kapabacteria bacterium]HRS01239.1 DUF4252 domain-containing protein [Bacteroidota bacterium]
MKKQKIRILNTIVILIGLSLQLAYSADIDKIMNKYSGQDGFTVVNIPGSSLGYVFNEMNGSKERNKEDDKKIKEIAKDISGIKILTYSKEDGGKILPNAIYNELLAAVNTKEYSQLMNVSKKDEKVMMLVKKDANDKVSEFLMLTYEPDEVTLIQITGKLNLNDIKDLTQPKENKK